VLAFHSVLKPEILAGFAEGLYGGRGISARILPPRKFFIPKNRRPSIASLSRRPIRPSLTCLRESEGLVGRYGGMELRRRLRGSRPEPLNDVLKGGDN
jgi:hypothetical protein